MPISTIIYTSEYHYITPKRLDYVILVRIRYAFVVNCQSKLNHFNPLTNFCEISYIYSLVLSGFCYFYPVVRNSFIHQVCIASWAAVTIQVLSSERKITQIADSVVATIALSCVVTSLCVSVKGFNTRKRKSYQPHAACHR